MTLTSLKSKAKVYSVILLLVIYGTGAYLVGRTSALGQILKIRREVPQRAIEAPIESPMPYVDTQSGQVISAQVKLCSNTVYGFEIAYPSNWFTTFLADEQKCNFFAPYSFVIPKDTNENFVPVKIEVINVDQWPGMVKFYENPNDFRNIISVQNMNIGEKIVHRIKASTTDEGVLPRDYDILNYLVFDSETSIIISYQQLSEEDDFTTFEKATEEIVNSLRFF